MKPLTRLRWCGRSAVALVAAVAGFAVALVLVSTQAGATPNVPAGITGGQTLTDGSTLESPDGHYKAILSDGVLSDKIVGGRTLWQAGSSSPGAYAVLQPNGSLVIFASDGEVLWDSGATGSGCPALGMQLDGNLVDYDTAAIWSTGSTQHGMVAGDDLQAGWSIFSAGGDHYELQMRPSGDLVLYNDSGKTIWTSQTTGNPGAYATLQSDGNFVVYSSAGKALWSSKTSGNRGATLAVQSNGNLVVYSAAQKALWNSASTGEAGTGTAFPVGVISAVATPCPSSVSTPTTTVVQTQTQTQTQTEIQTDTSTQTVLVPTTTVLTVAAPAPSRLRHFDQKVTTDWFYRGAITFLHAIAVGRLPRGVELTTTYDPHLRGHRDTVAHGVRGTTVVTLITELRRIHYLPGQTLNLNLTRKGYEHEWATFTFRAGKLPLIRPTRR